MIPVFALVSTGLRDRFVQNNAETLYYSGVNACWVRTIHGIGSCVSISTVPDFGADGSCSGRLNCINCHNSLALLSSIWFFPIPAECVCGNGTLCSSALNSSRVKFTIGHKTEKKAITLTKMTKKNHPQNSHFCGQGKPRLQVLVRVVAKAPPLYFFHLQDAHETILHQNEVRTLVFPIIQSVKLLKNRPKPTVKVTLKYFSWSLLRAFRILLVCFFWLIFFWMNFSVKHFCFAQHKKVRYPLSL